MNDKTSTWALTLWPLLAACGGSVPQTGVWDYTDETVVENTCTEAIDYDGADGEFTIENNDDGTFVVDPLDGTDTFTCTVDGKDFSCPERIAEVVDLGGGAEAELTVAVKGSFSNKTQATGTQSAVFACVNDTCEAAAAIAGIPSPCTIEVDFEAEWVEDL